MHILDTRKKLSTQIIGLFLDYSYDVTTRHGPCAALKISSLSIDPHTDLDNPKIC